MANKAKRALGRPTDALLTTVTTSFVQEPVKFAVGLVLTAIVATGASSWYCVVILALGGSMVIAVLHAMKIYSGGDSVPPPKLRRGRWQEVRHARIRLLQSPADPFQFTISGRDEGPVAVSIYFSSDGLHEGSVSCLENGAAIGRGIVEYLPDNGVRVTLQLDPARDDEELTFRRLADQADRQPAARERA